MRKNLTKNRPRQIHEVPTANQRANLGKGFLV